MKRLLIITILTASGLAHADFERDIASDMVLNKLGYITLKDIPIGETGIIRTRDLCINNNQLSLLEKTPVETKLDEYGVIALATKNADLRIDLKIYIPETNKYAQKESADKIFKVVLENIVSSVNCATVATLHGMTESRTYKIKTIDGFSKLSELLKKTKL